MGDAGPQYDESLNGQDTNTLHGSILRISVDSQMGAEYSVPGSNPYSGGGESRLLRSPLTGDRCCAFLRLSAPMYICSWHKCVELLVLLVLTSSILAQTESIGEQK